MRSFNWWPGSMISSIISCAFGGFILIFTSHLDDQFALIRSLEEFVHRAWRFLQPFDDVNAVFEFAFHIPCEKFGNSLVDGEQESGDEKCLRYHAADQDVDQIVGA